MTTPRNKQLRLCVRDSDAEHYRGVLMVAPLFSSINQPNSIGTYAKKSGFYEKSLVWQGEIDSETLVMASTGVSPVDMTCRHIS
jgi:hypothetical protein